MNPWETHYEGCRNRRPNVAYPRKACDGCRMYEKATSDAATRLWEYFKDKCGPITGKGMTAGPVCVDEIIALLEKP